MMNETLPLSRHARARRGHPRPTRFRELFLEHRFIDQGVKRISVA